MLGPLTQAQQWLMMKGIDVFWLLEGLKRCKLIPKQM